MSGWLPHSVGFVAGNFALLLDPVRGLFCVSDELVEGERGLELGPSGACLTEQPPVVSQHLNIGKNQIMLIFETISSFLSHLLPLSINVLGCVVLGLK